jgi:predicted NAD-dependent protein-ADP-ribosyltransferase YbiA (DUF1768 family)
MEVIKLGMIKFPNHTLSEYYTLKRRYEVSIQKQREKKSKAIDYKCPNCNSLKGLQFYSKDNYLYSVCQTELCRSNLIIPIYKYTTYEKEYQSSKDKYNESVQQVLKEKFDVLFNYKQGKDVPIDHVRKQYLSKKEYMNILEQSYRHLLTNPDRDEKRKIAYVTRDQIIDQLKYQTTTSLLTQLHEVIKTIRDLEYSTISLHGQVEHVHSEYSLQDLELKRTRDSVEPTHPVYVTPTIDYTLRFTFKNSNVGLELSQLSHAYQQCKQRGLDPHILDLSELSDAKEPAYLFLCEGWLDQSNSESLLKEQVQLDWSKSKKGFTYSEKGVSWKRTPKLLKIHDDLPQYFENMTELEVQGTQHHIDNPTTFQGSDHKVHIALHVGAPLQIKYQWYKEGERVGSVGSITIPQGTLYAMNSKALGNDWKKSSSYTLRHSFGNQNDVSERITIDIHQLTDIQGEMTESKVRELVNTKLKQLSEEELLNIKLKEIRKLIEDEEKIDLSKWKDIVKEVAMEIINGPRTPKDTKEKKPKKPSPEWYITFQSKKKEFRSLSNFYEFPVTVHTFNYASGEHAFHGEKFRRLGELAKGERKQQLLHAAKEFLVSGSIDTPLNAKKQGRHLVALTEPELVLWDRISMEVQHEICTWKLEHSEQVRTDLIASQGKTLIHSAGRTKLEDMAHNKWAGKALEEPGQVVGHNELGKIWMKVRETIKN